MYDAISYDTSGSIAVICHNRPQARNAESQMLLDELAAAVDRAVADADVKVIVIGGKGEHFSAGHDVKEAQESRSDFTVEQRWDYEAKRYYGYALKIWDCPKPVIAMVQGACISGGFMIANMCDLIVASEDAFFADPVLRTMGAAAVEVLVHPWVMGQRRAREFLYTGEKMSAAEALQIGMVNRVVPRAELEEATLSLAAKIAEGPGFSLMMTKRSLNRAADMQGFRTSLEAHFDTHQLSHVSESFGAAYSAGLASTIAKGKSS